MIKRHAEEKNVEVSFMQSNHEGDLVDAIQQAYFDRIDGIIINPGAYTHTSIAIMDAVKAVMIPTVEVHIANVSEREDYRQISYIGKVAVRTIAGYGFDGYNMAMDHLIQMQGDRK
jgi:3-dehydroquinate dehydratase-2